MKRTFLSILAALLTATTATAEVIGGISYSLSGNTATVKRDNSVSYSGELNIPPTVTYDGVTYTVTTIDSYALQDISMVTKLSLPASIKDIGSHNFVWKNSLESITVAEGNPTYDSRGGCNALIETSEAKLILGCKNTVIPEDVTVIGERAFSYTGLTTAVIPESVITIDEAAFAYCTQLTTFTILGEVSDCIDENAFTGCESLTDVYCYSNTPPNLDSYTFEHEWGNDGEKHIKGITLHVPAASVNAYKEDYTWGRFDYIVPLPAADVKGDANNDGRVDIADVAAAIAHILGQPTGQFSEEAADMDGNGSIDIDDVQAIVTLILNQ